MEYTEAYMNEVEAVVNNEEAAKKLSAAMSVEELKKVFAEYGVEIEDSLAEAAFQRAVDLRNGGELSADELDMVAGGKLLNWKVVAGVVAIGAIAATGGLAAIGMVGGYAACVTMIGIAGGASLLGSSKK